MMIAPNLTASCTRSERPNHHACVPIDPDVVHLERHSRLRAHYVGSIGRFGRVKTTHFAAHLRESQMPCIMIRAKVPESAGFAIKCLGQTAQ